MSALLADTATDDQPCCVTNRSADVRKIVNRYVAHLRATGRSEQTVRAYRPKLVSWIDWAPFEWRDFHTDAVAAWSQTLAPGRATRKQAAAAINAAAEVWAPGLTPGASVVVPRRSSRPRWRGLSPDQVRAVLGAADDHGRAGLAMTIMLYTGLRRSEVAELRWDGVDLDQRRLVVGRDKTDDWHILPLHGQLVSRLELRHPGPLDPHANPHIFAGRFGGHVNPGTINRWCADVADAAGVGHVHPHQLRHTAAVAVYIASGRDLIAAQRLLGHADPRTTARYCQASVHMLADALDCLDYAAA